MMKEQRLGRGIMSDRTLEPTEEMKAEAKYLELFLNDGTK